ncbi:MMB_0454 family protein [Spiroplasma endosymbiont of Labia minor]|uniref:MMB_0454 family protein n=1 Tax=Spiroplasma endosymbiont of Labia minor TaxID=3066305 RepID=UPI0030D17479
MYVVIQKNTRGVLEIEEKALIDLITYLVRTNSKNLDSDDIKVHIFVKHEVVLFVNIELFISNIDEQIQDENNITSVIEEAIVQTLQIKPKNVSYVYTHK